MDELIAFITARLDEDEAAAKAAGGERWSVGGDADDAVVPADRGGNSWIAVGPWGGGMDRTDATHIVRHDPARVLRDIAAKRRILHDHTPQMKGSRAVCSRCHYGNPLGANWPCLTTESLATVWSDHPGYRQEWGVS